MGNPANLKEYTDLTSQAKLAGGPEPFQSQIYDNGFDDGRHIGIQEGIGIGWGQAVGLVSFFLSMTMTAATLALLVYNARRRKEARKKDKKVYEA